MRWAGYCFLVIVMVFLYRGMLLIPCGSGHFGYFMRPDSRGYLIAADVLWKTGQFGSSVGMFHPPYATYPEFSRTPGYPLLLIPDIIYTYHSDHAWWYAVISVLTFQWLVSAFLSLMVYRFSCLLDVPKSKALWAALIVMVDPASVIFSTTILSETLYTVLLTVALFVFLTALRNGSRGNAAGAGVLLAACAFVRPIGLYLPILAGATLLANRSQMWRTRLIQTAILLTCAFVPCGAWIWRNHAEGGPATFSTIAAENLYYYEAAAVIARREGRAWYDVRNELYKRECPEHCTVVAYGQPWQQTPEGHAWLMREAKKELLSHPFILARIHLEGAVRMLFDPASVEWLRSFGTYPENGGMLNRLVSDGLISTLLGIARERPGLFILTLVLGLANAALILCACVGAWRKRRSGLWLCLTGVLLYHIALGSGPQTQARFRVPVVPVLALLAVSAWRNSASDDDASDDDTSNSNSDNDAEPHGHAT